ncbi:MAG: hypothetical protein AB8D52_06555 [Gammaproteobacteria bacterium]
MSDLNTSNLWYRVSDLKPELRHDIQSFCQEYRQTTWYIFRDDTGGKHHRFNQISYQLISFMNGQNSLLKIWELMQDKYDEIAPTQDEILQLVGQLHAEEIIQCEVSPDNAELFERHQKQKSSSLKNAFMNPLALRLPLINPNNFLDKLLPETKFIFTKAFLFFWLFTIATAAFLMVQNWTELTENVSDKILTANNLLIISLLYPPIKLLHELGHAMATKAFGGKVYEMGVIILALLPNPYVDTTSAWSFNEKYQRIIVSAAGMMVELFIAACALFLWLLVEPGLVRATAFNVMVIASVTTLLFNANPLLKFDGYYILSDLIEIPNLATRSNKYIAYLVKRYLFGIRNSKSPSACRSENKWFVFYAISAFFYRYFILSVIILFIASKMFFIGVLLACWVTATQFVLPVLKQTNFLLTNPIIGHKRQRAIFVTSTIFCLLTSFIFFFPVPDTTMAQGVIRPPDQSEIRAETSGFVKQVLVKDGSFVEADVALIKISEPSLLSEEKIYQSKLKELTLKMSSAQINERTEAEIIADDITSLKKKLDHISDQKDKLIIRSKDEGVFSLKEKNNLENRYLKKGDLIAYVIKPGTMFASVVLPQNDMDKIDHVSIKLASDISNSIAAKITREIPASSNQLPNSALGTKGGGPFVTNPQDSKGLQTIEPVFHFDIKLNEKNKHINQYIGGRVYAKFTHNEKPLAQHWYRSIRQLFLSHFDI